jgi:hypothetical protein
MTMKKQLVARGIAGALSLCGVLGLVGCGAETGDSAENEIGSTSEALTSSSITSSVAMVDQTSPTPVAQPRQFASSCKITDTNGKQYLLVAGGKNGSGNPTRDFFVFDPAFANAKWIGAGTFGASGDEVAEASMLVDPANAARCIMTGGDNAGTSKGKIWEFTVNTSGVVSVLQQGVLNDIRSNHTMIKCPGNKILIGAGKSSTAGDAIKTLEVYDPSTRNALGKTSAIAYLKNSNASPAQVQLNDERFDHAVAQESGSPQNIIFAGGKKNAGPWATVEALVLDANDCKLASSSDTTATRLQLSGSTTVLSSARSQLAAFYDSTATAKFVIAAGDASGTKSNVVDLLTVNFGLYTVTRSTGTTSVATARPTFIPLDTTRFVLVGGVDPSNSNAIADVQEYSAGTWTSTNVYSGGASLPARLGATGAFITADTTNDGVSNPTSQVYSVGGANLNSMDKIGPTGL